MFELMPFGRRDRDLFDEFYRFEREMTNGRHFGAFRTDILEKDNGYVLRAELPGFNKEDIAVDIADGRLTIRAEHKDAKEPDGKYLHRETFYGKYMRTFDLDGIDEANVTASYRDGILELVLPKCVEQTPPARSIEFK